MFYINGTRGKRISKIYLTRSVVLSQTHTCIFFYSIKSQKGNVSLNSNQSLLFLLGFDNIYILEEYFTIDIVRVASAWR